MDLRGTTNKALGTASSNYWGATPTSSTSGSTGTTSGLPTSQLTGQSGPYSPQFIAVGNQLASTGTIVPYSSQYAQSAGINTNTTALAPAGPTPEQIAAQEATRVAAEQAAKVSALKSNVQKLVGDAMGVYDALYGNLGTAAASQKKQLEEQFGAQESEMQQQFAQELPRIGTAYAGRGAYDSSWRMNAENAASDQMLNQLKGLGMEREAKMSSLGKSVFEQEAQFKAGQDALNRVLADLSTTTDVEKLSALQTDIQRRISELEASKAGLQSQEAFTQKFQEIGGPSTRTGQVKAIVDNILIGPAVPELKQRVAAGFIQTSGLSPEEQDTLIQYLNGTIDRLVGTPTTAPTTPTPTA